MQRRYAKDLLTSGQAAAVLHVSQSTVTRWANSGELEPLGRIAVAHGVFIFEAEKVKQKAIDLALGPEPSGQLDLDLERKAS